MKILILCSSFAPEPNGISIYSTDLATFFAATGHNVKVLTTGVSGKLNQEEIFLTPELEIERIKLQNTSSSSVFFSIVNEILLTLNFWKLARRELISPETVIVSIVPSLSAGVVARHVSKRYSIPHLTIFQDFSSLGSRQIGSKVGKLVAPFIDYVERIILRQAKEVVVVSDEMVKTVRQLDPNLSKRVHLIHNYFVKKAVEAEEYDFRKEYNIDDSKFVVMHTGNIGRKQGIENVLNAASLLLHEQSILFVIIGGGNQEDRIRKLADNLSNVLLLPFQDQKNYSKTLRSANILLVNEISTQLGMSLPSKCTSYLESGVPIVAAVPLGGPTARFLAEKALIVRADVAQDLADAVLKAFLGEQDLTEMALHGKNFLLEYLDANKSRSAYLKIVESLLPGS